MLFRWPHMALTIKILKLVFEEGNYADKVLEKEFRAKKQMGANDRRAVAEATYDILRWWRRLHFYLGQDWKIKKADSDYWWLGLTWLAWRGFDKPNWEKVHDEDWAEIQELIRAKIPLAADFHSVPDDLYNLGIKELGQKWEDHLEVLNEQAPVFLRTNTLKINRKELKTKMEEEGYLLELFGDENALVLKKRANVFISNSFKSGYFEVQDFGSQKISAFLDPQPGQRIVDACAGAGGKSLDIAARMGNKGKVIALDVHSWKLNELSKRASRAGVDIVEVRPIEDKKVVKRLYGQADKLLLDVPCTGMGVLKRNPDTKWKFNMDTYQSLLKTQKDILLEYSHLTKSGGEMVYSTCSIFPSENQKQIEEFLKSDQGKNWQFIEEKVLPPLKDSQDGFYMAKLRKH